MTHSQTQGADGAGTKTAGQAAYEAAIADLRYAPRWSDMTEADHQQWDRVAAAILTKACEPWELCFGDPPECGSPLHGVFVAGMIYTERLLASLLNLSDYEHGDGSEDFDADATQSLRNILIGASLWDADENRPVSPAPAATSGVPDSVRALSEAASPGEATFEIVPYHLGDTGDTDLPGFLRLGGVQVAEVHEKYGPGVDPRYEADGKFIAAAVNHVRALIAAQPAGHTKGSIEHGPGAASMATPDYNIAAHPAGQSTDDGTDRCEVCNKPLIAGQRVMQDVELGTVHAACCGPEREAYVKDVETGEPLGPNDPIPQGYVYEGEEPAGQERPDRKWVCNGDPAAHPAGQAGDAGADARTVLTEACKPWEHYMGEPPDDGSPLSGVFVAGMVYTERLLAKLLDVTHYEGGDGSEDFDNDATQTLRNILTGAGLWDADENRAVKPAPDSTRTGAAETEGLDLRVDTQVWTAAASLEACHVHQPAWLWFTEGCGPTFGRWASRGIQAPYVRADIALALAARPEAPSDAGWSFDMEAAPRDGTPLDLWCHGRRSIDYRWDAEGRFGGWWSDTNHKHRHWRDRECLLADQPTAWRLADTPPSDPAPSGQAEG